MNQDKAFNVYLMYVQTMAMLLGATLKRPTSIEKKGSTFFCRSTFTRPAFCVSCPTHKNVGLI